jgi:hypothetical protein
MSTYYGLGKNTNINKRIFCPYQPESTGPEWSTRIIKVKNTAVEPTSNNFDV